MHWHSGAILLTLAMVAGCSTPRDSRVRADAAVPRRQGRVDLTIGSLGGAHDQFGSIGGLARDRAGRLFIADAGNHAVAAFDSAGRFLYQVAGSGRGPGEVAIPCCLAVRDSVLWVRDAGNGRYNRYLIQADRARFLGQVAMVHTARGYMAPLTFDPAGRLIDVGMRAGSSDVLRFHLDSTGRAVQVDTVPAPPPDSVGEHQVARDGTTLFLHQPYGPRLLVAHAPDGGWARAVGSRYLVHWQLGGDSAGTETVRRDLIGPALSLRERQLGDSLLRADARRAGLEPGALPYGVPGAKPPVAALMFDQQGRLWVQMSVADGERRRADIYDRGGRRVAMAEWPADIDLRNGYLDDRLALGVREDSAGVPQVVRLTFSP